MTWAALGEGMDGQPPAPVARDAGAQMRTAPGHEVEDRAVPDAAAGRHASSRHLELAGELREGVEGAHVTDAGEHESRTEERREAVGVSRPSAARLGEVLEAGAGHEPLAAPLAHDPGQIGERGDV